ncbi:hypothetical protein [Neisseria iguanae]|uniref:Tc1-like transposase DDE domain-containing protein n=1 Tax=Neisseria iguanae TaxID=90242 RepID=A0A2P7TYA8_9NEIS|nr:hypothetical protein [Neisseria iguanae]PSJ79706.1 hypothetical protein C7N83_10585 [Neisseria iguanae]
MNHRQANEAERAHFLEQLQGCQQENRPIVYLDESGFNRMVTGLMPVHLKAGHVMAHTTGSLKTKPMLQAIHNGKLLTVGLYGCSTNSDIFHHRVGALLLPELPQNSAAVTDNAAFHKKSEVVQNPVSA